MSEFNSGYRYLFCCIDIYTRYAWVRLMKSKKANECLSVFKDILKSAKENPLIVMSDKGSEIKNKLLLITVFRTKNEVFLFSTILNFSQEWDL